MAKEALPANSFTKEERPRTGRAKSPSGFGRGLFGKAVFGRSAGYEQTKEALASNSFTEEALPSKIT